MQHAGEAPVFWEFEVVETTDPELYFRYQKFQICYYVNELLNSSSQDKPSALSQSVENSRRGSSAGNLYQCFSRDSQLTPPQVQVADSAKAKSEVWAFVRVPEGISDNVGERDPRTAAAPKTD